MAFAQLEPFGFRADWAPFAVLMALLANINRNPKKSKRFKADDFMPKEPEAAAPETDWQTMMKQAFHITQMLGGTIAKDRTHADPR
jgi:hypothetical protein